MALRSRSAGDLSFPGARPRRGSAALEERFCREACSTTGHTDAAYTDAAYTDAAYTERMIDGQFHGSGILRSPDGR
jgi:hypothetical protein